MKAYRNYFDSSSTETMEKLPRFSNWLDDVSKAARLCFNSVSVMRKYILSTSNMGTLDCFSLSVYL